MRKINLAGKQFGRLTVIKESGRRRGHVIWECICSCGTRSHPTSYDLRSGHSRSCGCLSRERGRNLTGNKNPAWHGKRKETIKQGYVYIHLPSHPKSNSDGYIAKHIVVAEGRAGRYLGSKEVVHHIDGNTQNNAAGNLLIMDNRKHLVWHRRLNEIAIYD